MALQEAVAVNYAITCGCRCFLLNSGERTPEQLIADLSGIINQISKLREPPRRILKFIGGVVRNPEPVFLFSDSMGVDKHMVVPASFRQ